MSEPAFIRTRTNEPRISVGRTNTDVPGGDCAQVIRRRNGEVLCFLGDVTGHDSRAAEHARELESRVCDVAAWMSPGAILTRLNSALAAVWPSDMFVCAICLALDLQTGHGTLAIAGQMPPLIRGSSSTRWLKTKGGPALGLLAAECYAERTFVLGVDDLFVAVTDGVTAPLACEQDLLGLAALVRIVDQTLPAPESICTALLGAAGHSCAADDATVLTVAPAVSASLAHVPMAPEPSHLVV